MLADVEFITNIKLEECAWIKVHGGRSKESLYIGCFYMPTTTASVSTMDACYENLKEDVNRTDIGISENFLLMDS